MSVVRPVAPPPPVFDAPACADADPDLFFAPSTHEPDDHRRARERAARDVCTPCPAFTACDTYAVTHDVHGIWAGRNEQDRAAARRTTIRARQYRDQGGT